LFQPLPASRPGKLISSFQDQLSERESALRSPIIGFADIKTLSGDMVGTMLPESALKHFYRSAVTPFSSSTAA
jgi:hypothetical protein